MDQSNKKTSRLCVLVSPQMKQALDALCEKLDTTASQVVRQLVRQYIQTDGRLLERPQRR